jgi:hypothetical protein
MSRGRFFASCNFWRSFLYKLWCLEVISLQAVMSYSFLCKLWCLCSFFFTCCDISAPFFTNYDASLLKLWCISSVLLLAVMTQLLQVHNPRAILFQFLPTSPPAMVQSLPLRHYRLPGSMISVAACSRQKCTISKRGHYFANFLRLEFVKKTKSSSQCTHVLRDRICERLRRPGIDSPRLCSPSPYL